MPVPALPIVPPAAIAHATAPAAAVRKTAGMVIYTLTTDGSGDYAAMLRLSLASLRESNPGRAAVVVCDPPTRRTLERNSDRLLDEADEVLTWETPPGSLEFRSRFLKTTLRQHLAGPLLYLDTDTLVRGSLAPIFATPADVAGAANHSRDTFAEQFWAPDRAALAKLGWETCPDCYVNAGVLFSNDTPAAKSFYADWHARWQESCARLGGFRDQPAFNSALRAATPGLTFAALPHRFNAQFRATPQAVAGAVVWHYYTSGPDTPAIAMQDLVRAISPRQPISRRAVRRLVRRAWPWRRESWLDGWVFARLARTGEIDRYDRLWFAGQRYEAVRKRCYHAWLRWRRGENACPPAER